MLKRKHKNVKNFKVTCFDHIVESTSSVKYLGLNIDTLVSEGMVVNNILSEVNDRLDSK